jgi:hypothetical protein
MTLPTTTARTNQTPYSIALSPAGHPYIHTSSDESIDTSTAAKLASYFTAGYSCGLLRLGISTIKTPHAPSITFWQSFGQLFITEARRVIGQGTDLSANFDIPIPDTELAETYAKAPFMRGSEYLNIGTLCSLWIDMTTALKDELIPFSGASTNGAFYDYLAHYNPTWNKVGRVCFHLAENKTNQTHPFAFLATYTTQLSATSNVQHVPLGQALKEYAGDQNRAQLLALLVPVQKTAEKSTFIKDLLDRSAIFGPQAWTPHQAHTFLKEIPQIEESGVLVRVPNWWTPKHPPRPQVSISIGNQSASAVGMTALLDFDIRYSLPNGESLTYEELQEIIARQEHLVQIKGQWVEVDQAKLSQVLSHWQDVAKHVKRDGLSFSEGLRLIAGAGSQKSADDFVDSVATWSHVTEGTWLEETLNQLRHPDQSSDSAVQTILARDLKATLRPYQLSGVQWLWWLYKLRLGGCLADDMGLGKTIQVLSLFLLSKEAEAVKRPHLLILPASLLGNWHTEIMKFAPSLTVWIAHGASADQHILKQTEAPHLTGIDLVITTYSNVYRLPWINKVAWNIVICDEAQSIKNPTTKQTLAIKRIPSQVRFILTGTPVENRLLDLWSLFDFVAPGLLGTSKAFSSYGKKKVDTDTAGSEQSFFASVRQLISPYILRRLKTDKTIIADLPDKTEVDSYCFLTKNQIALYQQTVQELAQRLQEADQTQDGMARRGLVLSYLMRLKQICNHPDQWLGHGDFDEQSSGKFLRLKELCEDIAAKQEKVLIFTQYREIIPALQTYLAGVFGRSGLVLHGGTAIKERSKLVDAFQTEQGPPFFILSIKAGGTGLTLTNASHVIHFDRWWNPAVENQATDRAYRIGQKKNVLVHKFICQGTIEEKIDFMINQKKALASDLLQGGGETLLTEMSNDELMKVVSLDIHRALGDG